MGKGVEILVDKDVTNVIFNIWISQIQVPEENAIETSMLGVLYPVLSNVILRMKLETVQV